MINSLSYPMLYSLSNTVQKRAAQNANVSNPEESSTECKRIKIQKRAAQNSNVSKHNQEESSTEFKRI